MKAIEWKEGYVICDDQDYIQVFEALVAEVYCDYFGIGLND